MHFCPFSTCFNKSDTKRIIIFFTMCFTVRLLFVILAMKLNNKYLQLFSIPLLLISIGFSITYYKKKMIGAFKGRVWWHNLRPLHSLLYLYAFYMAYNKNNNTYKILLFDLILGTISLIIHYLLQR